ncbi:glycosyltransferase [Pedobacter jejuensis]|uniref:Glycosyltransferase n=1 Tax=Pedobacter jejuensis TaxID=1268550 RepID=A0A3N0C109_9SPHI|nr:glycosyltransferase [Pedobacter jejuensis]RNL55754.1 glycosyltransferase [Pedobacter jejuensis]
MNQSLPKEAKFLFRGKVHPSLKLSVIVPAKDESDFIVKTLDALRMQLNDLGIAINSGLYEVLVLANNCNDDTYEICRKYQQRYKTFHLHVECIQFEKKHAHIGTARRLLMDAAHDRLMSVTGLKGIIVSTDADSEVAPDWIYHILKEIATGADVVGGRILPRDTPEVSRKHHLRDVTYRFLKSRLESSIDPCDSNPWPRHFQCYGPSLAVTCEMYERAGRLPVIPFLEDEEFRKALNRVDAKIRHSPNVRIYTSGRLDGRVKFGFSVQLKHWSEMSLGSEEQLVESLDTLIFKFEFKNRLRKIWNADAQLTNALSLAQVADWAEVELTTLNNIFNTSIYFESLWEKIEQLLHADDKNVLKFEPINLVISDMRLYFNHRSELTIKSINTDLRLNAEALAV